MTTKTKDILSTHTHIHQHLPSNDHLPLCESNGGRVRRRGVAPCLTAHGQSYWTTFVHVHNTRTERHTCHYSCWSTKDSSHEQSHTSWLQVILSASLCFSVSFSLPHHLFPPLTWRCWLFYLIRSHRDHYLWHFANTESCMGQLLRQWMCSFWLTLLWCSPGRSLQRPPERKEVLPESNQCFQIMPQVELFICLLSNKYIAGLRMQHKTQTCLDLLKLMFLYRIKYFFTVPELR